MSVSGKPDVFISYHTQSSLHLVEEIVRVLEADGIVCWYASRDAAEEYADSIVRAIGICRVFLLILNREASESPHVLNELDIVTRRQSRREKVSVVPFRVTDEDVAVSMQYYLGRLHWIDGVTPPVAVRISELTQQVRLLLRTGPDILPAGSVSGLMYRLVSRIPEPRTVFCGREDLIARMEEMFAGPCRVLFLEGIGGIGKSELAKQYAVRHAEEYETVVFVTFSENLRTTLCDPCKLEITGMVQTAGESQEDFYRRKLQALRQSTDGRTLIILDNFDVDQDPDLESFLEGSHRVLVTTRNAHPGYRKLAVEAIGDMDTLFRIFEENYGMKVDETDKPYIEELIRRFDGHTYMVELLAKQMAAGFLSGEELLDLYNSDRAYRCDAEVTEGYRGSHTTYDHIRTAFSLLQLTDQERQILMEMSLLDIHGISAKLFKEWAQLDSFESVNSLIRKSWIRREPGGNLSMHPLVCEVVHAELMPGAENCGTFLDRIGLWLFHAWGRADSENQAAAGHVRALAQYFAPFDGVHTRIWNMLPDVLWQLGAFDQAIKYGRILYDTCVSVHGEASVHAGYSAMILASCYRNAGRLVESIPWCEQSLRSFLDSGAEESDDLALAYERAAACYLWDYQRDYTRARDYAKRSLEIRQRLQARIQRGEKPPFYMEAWRPYCAEAACWGLASSFRVLSQVYRETGDYEKALRYAQKAGELMDSVKDVTDASRAHVVYNRGVCHYSFGIQLKRQGAQCQARREFEAACEDLEKSLKTKEAMLGRASLTVLNAEEALADAYTALGRRAEAADCFMDIAESLERYFPHEERMSKRIGIKLKFDERFDEQFVPQEV